MSKQIGRVILLLFLTSLSACESGWRYGHMELHGPNNSRFFFRLETRGDNNFLSLTLNPDLCTSSDREKDYVFRATEVAAFYQFQGNELHVYTTSPVFEPREFSPDVKVIIHQLTPLEFRHARDRPSNETGMNPVEIETAQRSCLF
jgi:hypothetical protein